jgi:hypothetical protein
LLEFSSGKVARGINSKEERHPALKLIQPGKKVGIYSLASTKSDNTYIESHYTTIYVF